MIGTLTGCVRKWWEGLIAPSFNMITNYTTIAFESSIFEGVDTFVRYIVNEFFGEIWMTDSIEQRRKDIREARNKLSQLQICKMKFIYEYTCEFRKWYYDAFDSNMKKFNYKRKNVTGNTSKDKSRCKCWKCGELGHYSNECQKEGKAFILWEENEEEDLESILSFDSEMSSVYSENDHSSSESDT